MCFSLVNLNFITEVSTLNPAAGEELTFTFLPQPCCVGAGITKSDMADFSKEATRAKARGERSLREQGGKGISGGVFCAQVITPGPALSWRMNGIVQKKKTHKYHNALRKVRLRFSLTFVSIINTTLCVSAVGAVV